MLETYHFGKDILYVTDESEAYDSLRKEGYRKTKSARIWIYREEISINIVGMLFSEWMRIFVFACVIISDVNFLICS